MENSPEYCTVLAHIVDINRCITPADLPLYAIELYKAELISTEGYKNAIAVTSSDKTSAFTDEAILMIMVFPDRFNRLVRIIEKRDQDLATRLLTECMNAYSLQLNVRPRSATQNHSLTVYVDKLKRVYQTPPTSWLSLPHITLGLTSEKARRYIREPDKIVQLKYRGLLVDNKAPVDMDRIFDEGVFENVHRPRVVAIEGPFGSGKSTLAYLYCQKWAEGNLGMFELVVFVSVHHPAIHSAGLGLNLRQLLLLASDGEDDIADVVTNVIQLLKQNLKCLIILDNWDEAPACFRTHPDCDTFLHNILSSVSPNTTILITSRPESSIQMRYRPNVKRVEMLGFTKESIHDYFRVALSTHISPAVLEDECSKLRDHLTNYPAIESSCYIPLNAAILALLYQEHNHVLPTTHFQLFYKFLLLLLRFAYEGTTRQTRSTLLSLSPLNAFVANKVSPHELTHNLGVVSSLDALPHDLKTQIERISILAYKGVINSKFVFSEDDLSFRSTFLSRVSDMLPGAAATPKPAQQDLLTLGVLQRVQWSSDISYQFTHPLLQEILAAYHISRMGYFEQVRVFLKLNHDPRFAAVLEFYAGFSKLTNRIVRKIIINSISNFKMRSLPVYFNCFFAAKIDDQSFYKKIIQAMINGLYLTCLRLSPLDCVSVAYFLAFALKNSKELKVELSRCNIDEHSFDLMMRELSKHIRASPGGMLHGVTELNISGNNIGNNGIAHIATVLQTNTTMRILNIRNCRISDKGAELLARVLAVNRSLQELYVRDNMIYGDGMAHISTALQTNETMTKIGCNISDERAAESLGRALAVNRSIQYVSISEFMPGDIGIAHIANALQTNNTLKILRVKDSTMTDEGVMLLAAALTANNSLERLDLNWYTGNPDSTLKRIGECVKSSQLRQLHLTIKIELLNEDEVPLTEEKIKKWIQCIVVGGKELIQSLEDSHLEYLHLSVYKYWCYSQSSRIASERALQILEAAVPKVNTARMQKNLSDLKFVCLMFGC